MAAVWMRAGGDLRRRWRSGLALSLVVGLVTAVVLTATAGARRTASSFDRFVAESRSADALVFPGEVTSQQLRDFANARYILTVGAAQILQLVFPDGGFLIAGAAIDDRIGTVVQRPRILEGRISDPRAADEVVISESFAGQRGLRVGDTIALASFTPAQVDEQRSGAATSIPAPGGPRVSLHVVGISRVPDDLGLSEGDGRTGFLLLTPGFYRRYGSEIGSFPGDLLAVRLRHGAADLERLVRRATTFFGDAPTFNVQSARQGTAGVQKSVEVLALGATVFAVVAGIAGFAAVGLALRRRVDVGGADQEVLRSLGMTRTQRSVAVGLPAVPVAVVGAVLGVLGAWLASPLMPMGLARTAEPDPGLHFDGLVLGVGLAVVVVVLLAVVGLVAWRAARVLVDHDVRSTRPTAVARVSTALGVRPVASIGAGMALERSGRRARVPVRSALVGAATAVLGVAGLAVFAASLDRLGTTPALYGFNWDARVLDDALRPSVPDHPCTVRRSRVMSVRGVADVATICSLGVDLGGRPVKAFGVRSLRGDIEPTVVAGRAPRSPKEVAVGAHTLSALGLSVGDRVRADAPDGPVDYRIVGVVAAPALGDPFGDPVPVDDSAFFTGAGLDVLDDTNDTDGAAELLIRLDRGADRKSVLRRIEHLPSGTSEDGAPGVTTALAPTEVVRLEQVDALPVVLMGFLAVLGVVSVGFVLATSVRRRGREFAILKTVGFSRAQVSMTVAAQATTTAMVGLLAGVPLGVVAGRVAWRSVADGIGVVSTPEVPIATLVVVALVTIGLANVIAALPARAAARTQPARVLRSE